MRYRFCLAILMLMACAVGPGCGGTPEDTKDPVDLKIEEGDSFDPNQEKSK